MPAKVDPARVTNAEILDPGVFWTKPITSIWFGYRKKLLIMLI